MASTPSLSEQLALLRQLLQGARIARSANLSAWVLLVWDHIITFPQEVEYIWRGNKKISNVIYVFLRYSALVVITFNVFGAMNFPESDKFCVTLMHMNAWPVLAINAVAECVMAARVVVLWDNSKWVMAIVSTAWALGVGGVSVLFGQRIPVFSKAMSLSLPWFDFYYCILPPEEVVNLDFWKMWFILLGYNTILGVLACAKAISTYYHKMRRRGHPALLQIIVRGSLDYYVVIIALNIAMLFMWRYGDDFIFSAGSGVTLPITVILSCRLILHLRQVYYGPSGEGETGLKISSSFEARSGRTITFSERVPLRSLTISLPK